MKKNLIIFIFGAALIVALDQITKAVIIENFSLHESRTIINGLFNIVYVMNPGAAFGFLANASEIFRRIFLLELL